MQEKIINGEKTAMTIRSDVSVAIVPFSASFSPYHIAVICDNLRHSRAGPHRGGLLQAPEQTRAGTLSGSLERDSPQRHATCGNHEPCPHESGGEGNDAPFGGNAVKIIVASIQDMLRNLARSEEIELNRVLENFAIARLFARLE